MTTANCLVLFLEIGKVQEKQLTAIFCSNPFTFASHYFICECECGKSLRRHRRPRISHSQYLLRISPRKVLFVFYLFSHRGIFSWANVNSFLVDDIVVASIASELWMYTWKLKFQELSIESWAWSGIMVGVCFLILR